MRDLDGRAACDGVAIEAQQTVPPERVEHSLHPSALVELLHLGDQRAPPGRDARAVVVEADEAQEHVPDRLGGVGPERAEQRVRPLRQRARHAAAGPVGADRDRSVDPGVEQLRQRVLHQRQRPRAIDDLAHHLGDDERVDVDADLGGRAGDRRLELLDRHRRDHLGAVAEQFAEAAMAQGAIVEVGPQGDDDPGPAVRRGDELDELVDEATRRLLVDLREQLLELVDHQEQLVASVGQHPLDGSPHATRCEDDVEHGRSGLRSRPD